MSKTVKKMPTQQRSLFFPIFISIVALVMVAVIVITVASNKKPAGKTGQIEVANSVSVNASTVNGTTGPDKLEEIPQSSADSEIGKIVPTISAQDFQAKEITIAPGAKPYVLVFLAHWCGHCQKEVPLITRLYEEDKLPKSVDFIAVATNTSDTADNYPPSKWLDREGWPWQIVADDQQGTLNNSMGGSGFPYVIYVNADGTIQTRTSGEQSEETIVANAQAVASTIAK
jgi:thiol-disulfide isomerase/thioredoxin